MKQFSCKYLGLSGSTNLFIEKVQGSDQGEEIYEARMGIAVMGYTNNINRVTNPFSRNYYDNYVRGFGTTQEKAIEALKRDMGTISDGLWA